MSERAGGAPFVDMDGYFQPYAQDESTSAYDQRPISDHDGVSHYSTHEACSSFLPLAPSFQQGSWGPPAPAPSYTVTTGGFLSNNPLHGNINRARKDEKETDETIGRGRMIQDNAANEEWYPNVDSDSLAARPHVTAEEWCKPPTMPDETYPGDVSTEFTASRVDRNQSQGYDTHQQFYRRPTAIIGPHIAYRANATHMHDFSYSSDTEQVSGSSLPANVSLDATQEPWSAVGAHPGGYNMLSTRCMRNPQSSEEHPHYPNIRNKSASSFVNNAGAITSGLSWPNNVMDQAGSYNLDQNVLTVRMKDVEHKAQGSQEQGISPFQYNVQEGLPSTDTGIYDPAAALNDTR